MLKNSLDRAWTNVGLAILFSLTAPGVRAGFAGDWTPLPVEEALERYWPLAIEGEEESTDPTGQKDVFRGFADPCMRWDPQKQCLIMTYSWPHVTYDHPSGPHPIAGVEIRWASSEDRGQTWQFSGVLWPKTADQLAVKRGKRSKPGHWSHEVSNLCLFDQGSQPRWLGACLDYFVPDEGGYQERPPRSFCLRLRMADQVEDLSLATPFTFGDSGNMPECHVDLRLPDLSAELPAYFIPNEPALFFDGQTLTLAFVALTFLGPAVPDLANSKIAVIQTQPLGPLDRWQWTFGGILADAEDAAYFGVELLTQIELARSASGAWLAITTPETFNAAKAEAFGGDPFFGFEHHGSLVFEVTSLFPPALKRLDNGQPVVAHRLTLGSLDFSISAGAATYDPYSLTGIVLTRRDIRKKRVSLTWYGP